MNDYPDLPIAADGYSPTISDGSELSRGSDGTPWVRILYSEERVSITLTHPALTQEESQVLLDFYAANRRAKVRYVEPGTDRAYVVDIVGPPQESSRPAPYRTTYQVNITGERIQ